jgi:hypothetical protein
MNLMAAASAASSAATDRRIDCHVQGGTAIHWPAERPSRHRAAQLEADGLGSCRRYDPHFAQFLSFASRSVAQMNGTRKGGREAATNYDWSAYLYTSHTQSVVLWPSAANMAARRMKAHWKEAVGQHKIGARCRVHRK